MAACTIILYYDDVSVNMIINIDRIVYNNISAAVYAMSGIKQSDSYRTFKHADPFFIQ